MTAREKSGRFIFRLARAADTCMCPQLSLLSDRPMYDLGRFMQVINAPAQRRKAPLTANPRAR
jgi:hypothetical protein